jgi:hypothetical protein
VHNAGTNPARGYGARLGGLPHADGRKGLLGHGLAARSSRGGGPCAHIVARAPGTPVRGHYAQTAFGTAWWWLADGKVLSASSWGPPGGHWATGAEQGLTEGSGLL